MNHKEKISKVKFHRFAILFLIFVSVFINSISVHASVYTYVDLINMLKNMERLSETPVLGEKSFEFSSRDKSSKVINEVYTNWSANNDGVGFVRTQADGGKVLAEMTGPGCIWRIWSATAKSGHVKIYLNGSATPVVDLPFSDYFNRTQTPFNYESLVYNAAGGVNNYIPIPYSQSCKIVAYDDWGLYFQINYTTFPTDTDVPTFTRYLSNTEMKTLSAVDNYFKNNLGTDPSGIREDQLELNENFEIPSGQTVTLIDYSGEGAITGFKIKVNSLQSKKEQWSALRELSVNMYWDGETTSSVWAPIGDFFGTACGLNQYKSLPLGVLDDGWMYCYWYMPFASNARITIKNDGRSNKNLDVSINRAPLAKPINSLLRFHAKWNRGVYVNDKNRWPDYSLLNTTGKGRFLGFMLHLYKKSDAVDPNSGAGHYWWGEGDEKFFVDGEKMPSWFGTGSEDYFGYAWATPDYFSKAYHNQIVYEGGIHTTGNRVLSRFQITDNIPFQLSFEATMEKYYSDNYVTYGIMPYWYQTAGTKDSYPEIALVERLNYYQSAGLTDSTRIEGEDMAIVSKTNGSLWPQYMSVFGNDWSNDKHMFWFQNNIGNIEVNDNAILSFQVNSSQNYTIKAAFTKAGDYGKIQLYIDNLPIASPFDFFNPSVIKTEEITLGNRFLSEGTHQLKFEIVGKNASSKAYYVGLDYLKLVVNENLANDKVKFDRHVDIYPVPAVDHLKLRFKQPINNVSIDIIDIQGKITNSTTIQTSVDEKNIDLAGYSKGFYGIRIIGSDLNINSIFEIK